MQDPRLQIWQAITSYRKPGSTTPQVWPPGHILAAKMRPKPRFHGLVSLIGGAFAPPIFVRSSPLGFAYKY